tara:strand:- start:11887 stop:14607 length:2721 start_codon:yes stop_codon:yes gene_type:complete
MKKIKLLVISCFFVLNSVAQNEASNWYFGENAGLSFNLGNNTVNSTSNGRLNTREGSSSISDDAGNLLFYTDGLTIWNKNHTTMLNGFGLNGDESSTQSAIIVPKPSDPDIYYVFTVDDRNQNGFTYGLNYSEVDMTLDGGLGSVTVKNVNLLASCSEKITAVLKDCISEAIWVVTFASEDGTADLFNTFHAFEVTSLGVNTTSVKSTLNATVFERRGYLKLSPDGTKVACANIEEGLYIYDFDTALGTVSNEKRLFINSTNAGTFPYGVEFSPNSKLLYVHSSNDFFDFDNPENNNDPNNHASTLTQFDVTQFDVQSSEVTIERRSLFRGALQLGPNGKIYRALSVSYEIGSPYLGVIESPNVVGIGCNYRHNAINLSPSSSSQGLPPFIASFFNTEIDIIKNGKSAINLALCDGDTYTLVSENIAGATYSWSLDDVPLTGNNFDLQISQGGHYEVYIDPNNGDCAIEGQAFVEFNENPEAFNRTILQCDEDGFVDGFTIFNLNQANDALAGGIPNRSTKFYTDIARTNEVDGNMFSNTANPQIIYVEVINDATGCYSTSELTLNVSTTDSNDTILPAVCDDDGIEDGLHVFNLSDANSDIINGLPAGLNISYFETYEDALLEVNNLVTTYTNTTPYNQTIYARAENANNCYGISEVTLIINGLPNILTEDLTYYCINTFPQTIPINAAIVNDSPSNYSYNWSNGENTFEIQINEPGAYSVTVTNANGCTKERNITVEPSNIASFETIEINDASQNNTITVFTSGEGIYEYRLLDENNVVYKPYQESNIFENVFPGFYTVSVRDVKNDCGIVNDQVSVIGFPKFFTPNNDGIHDTWQVYGVSSMFQPNTKILIYNRYGKLLTEVNPIGEGWDGMLNGERLPVDDYWFSITLQDGRIFKNHFTLKY